MNLELKMRFIILLNFCLLYFLFPFHEPNRWCIYRQFVSAPIFLFWKHQSIRNRLGLHFEAQQLLARSYRMNRSPPTQRLDKSVSAKLARPFFLAVPFQYKSATGVLYFTFRFELSSTTEILFNFFDAANV